ncbi:MAG: hypothetical protein WC913_01835, partial [Desulfuromonas sp.]
MHITRHLRSILILACGLLVAVPGTWSSGGDASAANLPTHAAPITYTDALGRQVQLDGTPQRVVSLVPSVTETIYAL